MCVSYRYKVINKYCYHSRTYHYHRHILRDTTLVTSALVHAIFLPTSSKQALITCGVRKIHLNGTCFVKSLYPLTLSDVVLFDKLLSY